MKPPKHHGVNPGRTATPRAQRTPLVPRLSAGRRDESSKSRVHRAEVQEERRFTAGARRQRQVRLTITLSVLGFVGMVAAIVLSPLMTLSEITVTGRVNVDEKVVVGAIKDQLGTPLALLDYDAIATKLGTVVQIQSFSTELRPPHTLVVRIVERTPLGAIKSANGWDIVDAAGVVMQSTKSAPASVPQIVVEGVDSPGFSAAVKALTALPPELRADVAAISASTRDTVQFVLRGVSHEIRWGSDEQATLKAAVLSRALEIAAKNGGEYVIDVSAPDTLIMNRTN